MPIYARLGRRPLLVQLGVEHKFEVLAIEKGGSQTITQGSFIPMP